MQNSQIWQKVYILRTRYIGIAEEGKIGDQKMSKKSAKKIEAEETPEQIPEQTQEVQEEVKEPTTHDNTALKAEEVMKIGYCEDEKARAELEEIVDALRSKVSLKVDISSGHDMTVKQEGRQILKVTPKKKAYSSSLPDDKGKMVSHSKKVLINYIGKFD